MSQFQTRLLIPRDTLFYYLNKYWGGLSGRPSCSIMASICCLDLTYQMLDVAAASLGWHSCFFRCSSDSPGWSSCATPSSRGTSTRNLSGEWPWKTKPNSWLDLEHTISWLSFNLGLQGFSSICSFESDGIKIRSNLLEKLQMIANTSSFCFTFSNPKLISAVFSALCHSCFDALLELFGLLLDFYLMMSLYLPRLL